MRRAVCGVALAVAACVVVAIAVKPWGRHGKEVVTGCLASAEQGDARAQFPLAVRYEEGDGVEKNAAEAVKWYRMAAEQGHSRAQCNLGFRYYKGEGVPKDKEEAIKWFRKAAAQGKESAKKALELLGVGEALKVSDPSGGVGVVGLTVEEAQRKA